jgi:hypothetical protein
VTDDDGMVPYSTDNEATAVAYSLQDAGVPVSTEDTQRLSPGCLTILMVLVLVAGFVTYSAVGSNAPVGTQIAASSQGSAQNSALPAIGPSGSSAAPGDQTPTQPIPSDETTTQPTTSDQTTTQPSTTQPAQQATPPPPAGCGYPASITVNGGDPSSLAGSGGGVTVLGSSIEVNTGPLVNCGQHYHLSMHGAHGTYDDCEMGQMDDTISAPTVMPNDFVQITLEPPPNNGC